MSIFLKMVVLRLRKIRGGLSQDTVAAPQHTNLFLQLFEALTFIACEPAMASTIIAFMLTQSGSELVSGLQQIFGAMELMAVCSE